MSSDVSVVRRRSSLPSVILKLTSLKDRGERCWREAARKLEENEGEEGDVNYLSRAIMARDVSTVALEVAIAADKNDKSAGGHNKILD